MRVRKVDVRVSYCPFVSVMKEESRDSPPDTQTLSVGRGRGCEISVSPSPILRACTYYGAITCKFPSLVVVEEVSTIKRKRKQQVTSRVRYGVVVGVPQVSRKGSNSPYLTIRLSTLPSCKSESELGLELGLEEPKTRLGKDERRQSEFGVICVYRRSRLEVW